MREKERMVRGPRHQRKEKPGKRGPKSWREKAKLPRKAGLDKRNQFRLNKIFNSRENRGVEGEGAADAGGAR